MDDIFYLPSKPEQEEYNLTSLPDSLRSSTLKGITISGHLDDMLLSILRGFAANTNTVDRTVDCRDPIVLNTPCKWVQFLVYVLSLQV